MAIRPVLSLPHEVLQTPAQPIAVIDDEARALGQDLIDTMRVSPGCVGLAATQIGVGKRAFCVDITGHKKAKKQHGLIVLFNPELVLASDFVIGREGCMSVPDLTGDVARATQITVRGLNTQGETVHYETDAFEARAFLHEIDHLDGLQFVDRVESPNKIFPRKIYK